MEKKITFQDIFISIITIGKLKYLIKDPIVKLYQYICSDFLRRKNKRKKNEDGEGLCRYWQEKKKEDIADPMIMILNWGQEGLFSQCWRVQSIRGDLPKQWPDFRRISYQIHLWYLVGITILYYLQTNRNHASQCLIDKEIAQHKEIRSTAKEISRTLLKRRKPSEK